MACHSLLCLLYSFFLQALLPLVRLFAWFSPKLARQLAGRNLEPAELVKIARQRSASRYGIVYFCSSAGEFEQAKPIIDRFAEDHDVYQHVIFFSKSGASYAAARGDSTPYSLSPIDSCFAWGSLFSALQPQTVVVVRHELWPAFLYTARQYARVVLIDAVVKPEEQQWKWWRRWLRRQLYLLFNRIFVVNQPDQSELSSLYRIPLNRLQITGDTKYDRVIERVRQFHNQPDPEQTTSISSKHTMPYRLVIGSAHRPDIEIVIAARARLSQASRMAWQLLIAPHDISSEMLTWIEDRCRQEGLQTVRYSHLSQTGSSTPEIVIIDTMGRLAELYGSADGAFVGGAMHHQVHNVLEPAAHGLPLAFGPHYKNSKEAIHLVDSNLATVCISDQAVADWWEALSGPNAQVQRQAVLDAVNRLSGAADIIYQELKQVLTPSS